MSVGLDIEAGDLERLQQRLNQVAVMPLDEFMDSLGGMVESQTHNRLRNTKVDPMGVAWKPWSEAYAGSKHGRNQNHSPHPGERTSSQGHTLLFLHGDLDDSMQWLRSFDEVEVGSNLKYARRQNAVRQILGLSDDNNAEILDSLNDFLDRHLGPLK